MAIELFLHNQQAYKNVLDMLSHVGKAAVIHPTGTGKSFIAFKLCEDFPNKKILWLGPSEYIFQTQMENLKDVTKGYQPENIHFLTYAKLMIMSFDEIKVIQPDYIILDEFHRCGAQKWGEGINALLSLFPYAALLGLSATNIRYLDNQRDMAMELFQGNIASEMSLGEAIVRGILKPPKYVLTGFQFERELKDYERRIGRLKSKAARDEADRHLEALRRALDKADGLDVVFQKHMDNPHGKYIVFCANYDHMREMVRMAGEWFSRIDTNPHIYMAYSDDAYTDRAFAAFKLDDSDHLRLLYCIDMLNEGIHVGNLDGVILLRPTISPIIYKQQIGRALSAGAHNHAVVFDVVQNIENLYSIGAIEEEMEQVLFLYRQRSQEDDIVYEQFRIVDELCDCMVLFDRLNDSLSASWDLMYQAACQYYAENGHLEISRTYVTTEGYCLGAWIRTQRRVYAGKCPGMLSKTQIEKLSKIGMRWGDLVSSNWAVYFSALCQYKQVYGNLDITARYTTPDGLQLGKFISNLRVARTCGKKNSYLTPERIEALDGLGMIWGKIDYQWELNYAACATYYVEHGHLNIPVAFAAQDGLSIGKWIRRQRKLRQTAVLSNDQIQRLDDIGMVWDDAYVVKWEKGYASASNYYQKFGNLYVPTTYVDENGYPLGKWLKRHREQRKDGTTMIKITPERRARLDALGMQW